jgi:hypothetical protein
MQTDDFTRPITSSKLKENLAKQFGMRVNLEKYDREQLENIRNLVRTRTHSAEQKISENDLLANEDYQKDKAMLQLLNTRIKEMLGEDIKKLRDKLDQLNEAKKGDGNLANNAKPYDKVTRGDVVAGRLGKDEMGGKKKSVKMKEADAATNAANDMSKELRKRGNHDQDTPSKFNKDGNRYTRKSNTYTNTSEPDNKKPSTAHTKADTQASLDDEAERAKYKGLRKVRQGGKTEYFDNGKQIKQAEYDAAIAKIEKTANTQRRLNAMGVRENANGKTCNKSSKGKRCPVHGLQECGMNVYESIDPEEAGFYVVDEDGNVVKGPFDSEQEAYEQAGRMHDVKYMGDVIPISALIDKIIKVLSPDTKSDDVMDPMDLEDRLRRNPLGRVFGSLSSQEQLRVTDKIANHFYKENGTHFNDADRDFNVKEGEDEGKPGKNFAKIAKDAGKRYGSKEAGERVAGAVRNKLNKQGKLEESNRIFKRHVRIVNESLAYLLSENEEDKAKAITAAGDIVNDYTSWMQRVGQYQTKSMIELSDSIRGDFGVQQAEAFKNAVGPALAATLEILTAQREAISNAVAVLAGEQIPEVPMGAEPGMEPGMDMAAPDMMNEPAGDEFAAADAAAGEGTTGREMRESAKQRRARKLAESHSIISKLAR